MVPKGLDLCSKVKLDSPPAAGPPNIHPPHFSHTLLDKHYYIIDNGEGHVMLGPNINLVLPKSLVSPAGSVVIGPNTYCSSAPKHSFHRWRLWCLVLLNTYPSSAEKLVSISHIK